MTQATWYVQGRLPRSLASTCKCTLAMLVSRCPFQDSSPATEQGPAPPYNLDFPLRILVRAGGVQVKLAHTPRHPPAAATVHIPVDVTLEQVYTGHNLTLSYTRQALCPQCQGTGAAAPQQTAACLHCRGTGSSAAAFAAPPRYRQVAVSRCHRCHGTGHMPTSACPTCHGSRHVDQPEHVSMHIPAGALDGELLAVQAPGNVELGLQPGKVQVSIRRLRLEGGLDSAGAALVLRLQLNIVEALLGFVRNITLPSGELYTLRQSTPVTHGSMLRRAGLGLPVRHNNGTLGDLLVLIQVDMPGDWSPAQIAVLAQLAAAQAGVGDTAPPLEHLRRPTSASDWPRAPEWYAVPDEVADSLAWIQFRTAPLVLRRWVLRCWPAAYPRPAWVQLLHAAYASEP